MKDLDDLEPLNKPVPENNIVVQSTFYRQTDAV